MQSQYRAQRSSATQSLPPKTLPARTPHPPPSHDCSVLCGSSDGTGWDGLAHKTQTQSRLRGCPCVGDRSLARRESSPVGHMIYMIACAKGQAREGHHITSPCEVSHRPPTATARLPACLPAATETRVCTEPGAGPGAAVALAHPLPPGHLVAQHHGRRGRVRARAFVRRVLQMSKFTAQMV